MTVSYEWDVETVTDAETEEHEEGEVLDHHHFDTYAEAAQFAAGEPDEGTRYVIVLVRDNDGTGALTRRAWAYMEDGKLPDYFVCANGDDVAKVPQKYHNEVARAC